VSGSQELLPRFTGRHVVNHLVMLVCFVGLVLTGLPQKFADHMWAKGLVLLFGGVERTRWLHHVLGTVMALQLVWHLLEGVWLHLVRRLPMPMMPALKDVLDFRDQVRFNLGFAADPPRMDRYTFAEKIEYLALVWGTAVMVLTGLVLLYPVRWVNLVPGEVILAAKAAHGGEALLALLSILTWHVYFVHVRQWNTSIFKRRLAVEPYVEEHPLEVERLRRDGHPRPAALQAWRVVVFAAVAAAIILVSVAVVWWLRVVPAGAEVVTRF